MVIRSNCFLHYSEMLQKTRIRVFCYCYLLLMIGLQSKSIYSFLYDDQKSPQFFEVFRNVIFILAFRCCKLLRRWLLEIVSFIFRINCTHLGLFWDFGGNLLLRQQCDNLIANKIILNLGFPFKHILRINVNQCFFKKIKKQKNIRINVTVYEISEIIGSMWYKIG